MKLVDMKVPKKTKSELKAEYAVPSDQEKYPYGLKISLEEDDVDKMDLDTSKLTVGVKVAIEAIGEITNVSQNQRQGEKKARRSVSIQITSIGIEDKANFDGAFKDATKGK